MLRSESLCGIPGDVGMTQPGIARRDGADGDRTHDLRLAKPALSQLSYSPYAVGNGVAAVRQTSEGRPDRPLSGWLGSALD